jgi:MYXO-CTERM domain-containing protein
MLGEDVCDNSTDSNGEAISWYFMVVEGGLASEYFTWSGNPSGTGIDVVGPAPPRRFSVGVGENQLTISMDPDDIPNDTTRERYEAFCVPRGATANPAAGADAGLDGAGGAGGSGGVTSLLDGGTVFDAGVGMGAGEPDAGDESAAPAACFTELLRVGARPPTDPQYSCGTTNAISGTLRTKGNLRNGTTYAVAVSGQDELGNAGVVSDIQCGTPMVLEDFYELYKLRGGPGGGGFCSVSPQAGKTGVGAATVLLMMLAGLGWRRSRGRA